MKQEAAKSKAKVRDALRLDLRASAHKEEGRLPGRKLVSAQNWRRRMNQKTGPGQMNAAPVKEVCLMNTGYCRRGTAMKTVGSDLRFSPRSAYGRKKKPRNGPASVNLGKNFKK